MVDNLAEAFVSLSKDLAALPEVLLQVLWLKDSYTARHARNVSRLAEQIGVQLGLDQQAIAELRFAGTLHDIGKVGVPEELLMKTDLLDEADWLGAQEARRARRHDRRDGGDQGRARLGHPEPPRTAGRLRLSGRTARGGAQPPRSPEGRPYETALSSLTTSSASTAGRLKASPTAG